LVAGALDSVKTLLISLLLHRDLLLMVMVVIGATLIASVVLWVFQMLQNSLQGVILVPFNEMLEYGLLILV
jgi:hypothetical protein